MRVAVGGLVRAATVVSALVLAGGPTACAAAPAAPAPGPAPAADPVAGRTHGMTIPAAHPRLWFDAQRLARAKAWFRDNTFLPRGYNETLTISQATHGLLTGSAESCRAALRWAIEKNELMATNATNPSALFMDYARWFGEAIIVAYDWCRPHLTPAERARFIERANLWIEARRVTPWGSVPMHQNNYYWGYLRNEVLWGIASYDENVDMAERFLADAIEKRLVADFIPATFAGSKGGVCQEGSQYGPYLTGYSLIPFATAALLGRDLYAETPFWKEAVYANVYATTPGPTVSESPRPENRLGYTYFPHSDLDGARWTANTLNGDADYMTYAAARWADGATGRHARQWLATTGAVASKHVQAVDPGGPALPFSSLPLDYYAPGPKYLYARTSWKPTATAVLLQLGDRDQTHVGGHQHVDWGSWQIWRGGRFVARETAAYGDKLASHAGGPPVDGFLDVAHNLLLIEGKAISSSPYPHTGDAVVTRLESQPGHVFAAVDLSATRGSRAEFQNRHFVTWVREFVFVRALETLVVLDRVESDHADDEKTFLSHCEVEPTTTATGATCVVGDQALVMTNLLPAERTYRVVREGSKVGQFRIEVDTHPRSARTHVLTVLQAKDASAPSLAASVVEEPAGFLVKLGDGVTISFEKGMSSRGGAIAIGGVRAALREGVQPFVVTDSGPEWR